MMTYTQACRMFDITETKRQWSKWRNQQGRAFKLTKALGLKIFRRKEENLRIDQENEEIRLQNEICHSLPPLAELGHVDLFTDLEVRQVLGQ